MSRLRRKIGTIGKVGRVNTTIIYINWRQRGYGKVFGYGVYTVGMEHIFTVRTLTDFMPDCPSYATPELCLPPISCRIVSPDTSRRDTVPSLDGRRDTVP